MTKRVLECHICGEALSAATDAELLARLRAHTEAEHEETEFDEERARAAIASDAYDAGDS
jgi:predicted small metal-binding protein